MLCSPWWLLTEIHIESISPAPVLYRSYFSSHIIKSVINSRLKNELRALPVAEIEDVSPACPDIITVCQWLEVNQVFPLYHCDCLICVSLFCKHHQPLHSSLIVSMAWCFFSILFKAGCWFHSFQMSCVRSSHINTGVLKEMANPSLTSRTAIIKLLKL